MAEEKSGFKEILDVADNVEKTASLVSNVGSFKDAHGCYKEFAGLYQDIGLVGKGQLFGEQLALVARVFLDGKQIAMAGQAA